MIEIVVQAIGYLGMALVLLTLALSRKHYKKSQIVSLIGGVCLFTNALIIGAYPFFILNVMWTLISIYNLWKIRRDRVERST